MNPDDAPELAPELDAVPTAGTDAPEPAADPAPEPTLPDAAPDPAARRSRTRAATPREAAASRPGQRAPGGRKKRRAAAREDTAPARGARTRETRAMTSTMLAKGLEQTIQGIAIGVTVIDAEDGAIIARGEPRLTAALVATAEQNPRFKKRLEELMQGGTYMQLAFALGAIVLPITMRHAGGLLPPGVRAAAAMMQHEDAPDAVPAEWAMPGPPPAPRFKAADGTELIPGNLYEDSEGPYSIDEAGNIITFDPAMLGGDDANDA